MAKDKIAPGRVIIIGGSAGSLEVVLNILSTFNREADAAIIVVMHRKSSYDSSLAEIFADKTSWAIREVEEKDPVLSRYVYLAPGDYHLLVEKDHTFSLDVSEKVNFSRPSIDISFESAAEVYGSQLTGILLSGANADGVEGLKKIKEFGGICIVQDPLSAEVSFMPQEAVNHAPVDHIVDGMQIGSFLNQL